MMRLMAVDENKEVRRDRYLWLPLWIKLEAIVKIVAGIEPGSPGLGSSKSSSIKTIVLFEFVKIPIHMLHLINI